MSAAASIVSAITSTIGSLKNAAAGDQQAVPEALAELEALRRRVAQGLVTEATERAAKPLDEILELFNEVRKAVIDVTDSDGAEARECAFHAFSHLQTIETAVLDALDRLRGTNAHAVVPAPAEH